MLFHQGVENVYKNMKKQRDKKKKQREWLAVAVEEDFVACLSSIPAGTVFNLTGEWRAASVFSCKMYRGSKSRASLNSP